MTLLRRTRSTPTWLLLGVVVALLNIGTLEVLRILHYATEEPCSALATGDLTTCFLCAHFSYVSGESATADLPPPLEAGRPFDSPHLTTGILERTDAAIPARAPPAPA